MERKGVASCPVCQEEASEDCCEFREKDCAILENLTWSEALRYCRQNHVDLVSVHSEEIQRRVMNVVKRASTAAVWLGLHNYCIMNMWLWVSGETVCYQNWAPGNGTKPENCKLEKRKGAVQSGGDQRWISLPETHKLNFICINIRVVSYRTRGPDEKEAGPSSPFKRRGPRREGCSRWKKPPPLAPRTGEGSACGRRTPPLTWTLPS
ncbi:lithostathine-1-alpha-like [Sinocyclocheilus rhinocerous]|uniref:lithostathine-1-alpha-like n=1 Tax=Sinocyclocheilus rhinocerous TaxID=307959 RepID=UPI0007B874C0|nr:PREDICTED: lithostathine-1-alpha-like [Sinocyclocheilus rhinocerous]